MKLENNQDKSKSHGGARKNAGRKEGAATKKTREIADKAAEEGITPLEVMLKAMREVLARAEAIADDKAKVIDSKVVSRLALMIDAAAIAKDAAPYIHPRLAAIEHTGKDGKDLVQNSGVLVVPATMTTEEWAKAVANKTE